MDEMVDLTVKVPAGRVGEFYSMFGAWLTTSPAPTTPPATEAEGEHLPWTDADGELARIVWQKCSPNAKKLFSVLIDNEGRSYSGEELAGLVGIPNGKHGVAGVLAWPGRHCFAVNRTWLWSWEYPGGDVSVYWLNPVVAALFRDARDN